MGVDVEGWRSQETDQGLAAFARKIHRERRRSGDRGNDWDSAGERFLDDFQRGPAANNEDLFLEWQKPIEKRPPERLVDGVVAADIFPHDDPFPIEIENPGRVNTAGPLEIPLLIAKTLRQFKEGCFFYANCAGRMNRRKLLSNEVDAGFAAEPAAARNSAETLRCGRLKFYLWRQIEVQDVSQRPR